MQIALGSNIAASRAQRQLSNASTLAERSFERLASGQRLNHASDDAAGIAIAETLRINSRVFNQARRNLADGVSLLSVGEEAVNSLKNILLRLRELAAQTSNGTYGDSQRESLNQEATALQAEYNRIIQSTHFNERMVFSETEGVPSFQAGYGADAVIAADADVTLDFSTAPLRVSTDSQGTEANGASDAAQISSDGRYILFESSASNLVSGDGAGQRDIFLKDLASGVTTRINTSISGGDAMNGWSYTARLSPDARYALFQSDATNLVNGDTNSACDIFRKDLTTGEMVRVNTSASNTQSGGGSSYNAQMTPDGRYVVFSSDATNLVSEDTNGLRDVFLKDTLTGETTRLSTSSAGLEAAGGQSDRPQITPDGRFVFFESSATNLVAGDTNTSRDIFCKDLRTGAISRVNTALSGTQASGGDSFSVQVTPDGRYVAFQSDATNLVGGDTNFRADLFIKDLVTGQVTRANTDDAGSQALGGDSYNIRISADARYAVFQSNATNLVSDDSNGLSDIFVKDMITGLTRRLNIASDGSEATGGTSVAASITADGASIVFTSSAVNLVGGDGNGTSDVFVLANPLSERFSIPLLHSINLKTELAAKYMQGFIDTHFDNLNNYQAQLGAVRKRIQVMSSVLETTSENNSAAESRIRDTDIAWEQAQLARTAILQSTATAVLTHAAAQPQLVLELLR